MSKIVYISGPLTNTKKSGELRQFYEEISKLCLNLGLKPYTPHQVSDPEIHLDLSPREVFELDKKQILDSALIIAYVGEPSHGVGMEIAYSETLNIPLIILYEKGTKVSRIVKGTPNVVGEVSYQTKQEALKKLHEIIISIHKI